MASCNKPKRDGVRKKILIKTIRKHYARSVRFAFVGDLQKSAAANSMVEQALDLLERLE